VQHIETGYLFIYIIKDLILKFVEWGELNRTSLMSFCRLNLKKHRSILDGMKANGLIARREEAGGKKVTSIYKRPQKGFNFLPK
jgi:predicted transcriptional regulator